MKMLVVLFALTLGARAHAVAPYLPPESTPTPTTPEPSPEPRPEPEPAPIPVPYCPQRFSVSLGAGPGFPIGRSADRADIGIHAAVDFRWYPDARWSLWAEATLALLPLVDGLPIEPGGGSSVSLFTVVVGGEMRQPLVTDLELALGLAVGVGGYGLAAVDEALGWAFDARVGARYRLDENLAVRLDFAPVAVIPLDADRSIGGHLSVLLRGEASF